jgi:putative ABC transport system permease protein
MIGGDPATALKEPHSVVLDERTALKYFNSTDVVGKTMTFNDTALYKVTGVIKNIPAKSHFNFNFLLSMPTLDESKNNAWLSANFQTYLLLKPGADYKSLEAKFPSFMTKMMGPQLESTVHMTMAQFERSGSYVRINLTPLRNIHLHSNRVAEIGANGNIQYVYIFSAVAIFILLIACVNFMNLSTARSANRAKEVGVRKVLGSQRKDLIGQFLFESVVITFIAAAIALFAAYALLPAFNQLSGKQLVVTSHIVAWLVPSLAIAVLVIGCLAGSYPALVLSAFQPIEVLKGKLSSGFKSGFLRSFLVVFQFAISIILIIGTLVIYNQLRYIQNRDIGYDREHVLMVNNTTSLGNGGAVLKREVSKLAGVEIVSTSDAVPTWNYGNSTTAFKSQAMDTKNALHTQIWGIDENYLSALGMKLVDGRNFTPAMATDSTGLIINETAARELGFKNPLNQMLYVPQDQMAKVLKPYHIIGVIKDFNFRSLRENVTALVFAFNPSNSAFIVRFKTADASLLISQIKAKWHEVAPNREFSTSFMDRDFEALYQAEQQTGKVSVAFTSLAIIIACLGLFGLAAYAAEQRIKEIGIRKVLGAQVSNIVVMLSKDFIVLVLIAIVVATPFAWWLMHNWLQAFAYRQEIQWWVIAVAGFAAVAIAFITVSFQAIKAALVNPVRSLRSE